jgi:hypothetical protein
VPLVELDQRARAACLRLERIEPLLMPRAAVTRFVVQASRLSFRLRQTRRRFASRPNSRAAE